MHELIGNKARQMQPDQPHNMAIAEFEHNGDIARLTGKAATEKDDAIQFIVDLMVQEGISGERILRIYSERKPNDKWLEYFAKYWPNAAVTWSFGPNEDAKMEAAVSELLSKPRESSLKLSLQSIPHFWMWCLCMAFSTAFAYSHGWSNLSMLPLFAIALLGLAAFCFRRLIRFTGRRLARMTPAERDKYLSRLSKNERCRVLEAHGIHAP